MSRWRSSSGSWPAARSEQLLQFAAKTNRRIGRAIRPLIGTRPLGGDERSRVELEDAIRQETHDLPHGVEMRRPAIRARAP